MRRWPTCASQVSTDCVETTSSADGLAQERQPRVLLERAGQEPRLAEHLEAVADADDRAAARRERRDGRHDRREPRDRTGAQVVAVREAAGQHDGVEPVEVGVVVPDVADLGTEAARARSPRRTRSWCPGNTTTPTCAAISAPATSTVARSITGLARSRSARDWASSRASASESASTESRKDLPGAHVVDAGEAERGQRALDRRALGVGDAVAQCHLDARVEPHGA